MNTAQPTLIGYFPRRKAIPPHQILIPPQIGQLANAGYCDGSEPDNWVAFGRHNELCVYDSIALAWSIVPPQEREYFQIFAYRMYPLLIVEGHSQIQELPKLNVTPLPPDWERLGYDPVTFTGLVPEEADYLKIFSHSPLSPFCNGRCRDIPVNRYCLLDSADDAFMRAVEFSSGGGEPGPYVVVEIWSKDIRDEGVASTQNQIWDLKRYLLCPIRQQGDISPFANFLY